MVGRFEDQWFKVGHLTALLLFYLTTPPGLEANFLAYCISPPHPKMDEWPVILSTSKIKTHPFKGIFDTKLQISSYNIFSG